MKDLSQLSNKFSKFIAMTLVVTLIQACSGGGGSGSNGDKDNNPQNKVYSISANTTSIEFNSEAFTEPMTSQEITVTYNGEGLLLGYPDNVTPVNWLSFEMLEQTATSARIRVSVVNTVDFDNSTALIPGIYQTTLQLTTGENTTPAYVHETVSISLDLWQLSTNKNTINFTTGSVNDDAVLTDSFNIITGLDSDTWNISTNQPWLTVDTTSGTGDAQVTVSASAETVNQSGINTATVTITDTTRQESKQVLVNLAVDDSRISTNYSALSLYQLGDQSVTSEVISISDNANSDIEYQAESNVNWLTVNVDNVNNTLTVNKNATLLTDGSYKAEITLSAVDNNTIASAKVYVGYYQSANNTATQVLTDFSPTSIANIAFDPLRPIAYQISGDKLSLHHLFTGATIQTITMPMALTNLTIAPNGQYLLASARLDTETDALHIYRINLNTLAVEKLALPAENAINFMPYFIANIEGKDIIVTETQEYASLDLTQQFWDIPNAFFVSVIQQSANTNLLTFIETKAGTPTTTEFYTFDIDYNEYASNKVSVEQVRSFTSATYEDAAPIYFDVSNSSDTIHTAQSDSEWLAFENGEYVEQGVLFDTLDTTSIDVKTDKLNNSYYYRARITNDINNPVIYSLTKYDSSLTEIWSQTINNGSGSSFIVPNFHRFITFNTDSKTWFATSFAN